MANLVVHFEIHATEPQRLIDFYSELLGWRFTQFGDTPYWTIETGEGSIGNVAGEPGMGINGGLAQREGPAPEPGAPVNGCDIVIGGDCDIDEYFRRAVELGAVESMPATDSTRRLLKGCANCSTQALKPLAWPSKVVMSRNMMPGFG